MNEANETTNAVLRESILGLSKLTDERFNNIQQTLLRIEASTHSFATKNELEEVKKDFTASVKRIEEGFSKHNEDDIKSFGNLESGQRETRDTLLKWGAIAGAVLIVLPFLSPIIIDYFKK